MVCRYASFFRSCKVDVDHVVAIYLTNSPEFLFLWLSFPLASLVAASASLVVGGAFKRTSSLRARPKNSWQRVSLLCGASQLPLRTSSILRGAVWHQVSSLPL